MIHLRVDDFPGTKPKEFREHNIDNFKRFHDVLMMAEIPQYTLGVIPKYTHLSDMLWLSSQDSLNIAQHGISHDENHQNEFSDILSEDQICSALHDVKMIEFYRNVTSYIPPHNVFDGKTCRALTRLGFREIYGGPGSHVESQDEFEWMHGKNCLKFNYSKFPEEYGRSDELMKRGSIDHLLKKDESYLTLHWTWEWNIGLDNLRSYISCLKGEFV